MLECLRSLPANLVMRDLTAVRDEVATVEEHVARLARDEDGYEIRREKRNYGLTTGAAIGLIGGPAVYMEV